jgi:hypothetical protein
VRAEPEVLMIDNLSLGLARDVRHGRSAKSLPATLSDGTGSQLGRRLQFHAHAHRLPQNLAHDALQLFRWIARL